MGEVQISWVGVPSSDFLTDKAIDVLNSYLTDSSISPLQKALVENEDSFATDIGFDTSDQSTTVFNLSLSSVPTEKLELVAPEVKKIMRGIVEEGIDMKRMEMILHREQRKVGFFSVNSHCAFTEASLSAKSLSRGASADSFAFRYCSF